MSQTTPAEMTSRPAGASAANLEHITADVENEALNGLAYRYDGDTHAGAIIFANPYDGDDQGTLHLQPGANADEVRFTITCSHAGVSGYRRGTDEELTDQFTDILLNFFAAPNA